MLDDFENYSGGSCMILIEMKRNGEYVYRPGMDMALQEYVRQNIFLDDDIMMPYTSSPQVQMGRYQNAVKEVNLDAMKEKGVQLCRRDTGGGAIYLDRGNTSFCYLINDRSNNTDLNFQKLYEPVVEVLHDLGAKDVEFSGRNDLKIGNKKISGAAMSLDPTRFYAGYSLMLDVDFDTLTTVLTPNRKKIEAKGVDSVRQHVDSIRHHLAPEYQNLTPKEFHDLVACRLLKVDRLEDAKQYVLTDEDWAAIDKRCEEKWFNWNWVYGESPEYQYTRNARLEGIGTFELHLTVDKSRISEIKIYGDFFGSEPIQDVEKVLLGVPAEKEAIVNVLKDMDLKPYFNAQIHEELADIILS
ncbi:lipoyltransferase and lipoate-protein ligase [Aerococcus christensenii]|uniref:lipoate--protein ligase n=2 Tax=Aerococcus christensenii TaxID=87541 RepID=A0A133Y4E9_9LACT|nr:lipoyltransferase and lipoate-protein ligase [Aerococcus christensenii]